MNAMETIQYLNEKIAEIEVAGFPVNRDEWTANDVLRNNQYRSFKRLRSRLIDISQAPRNYIEEDG